MNFSDINGLKTYVPLNSKILLENSFKKKKILIAINAEKIVNSCDKFKNIVKNNIGYPDGFGAVLALKKKGFNHAEKIPGSKLWLDVVRSFYKSKTFYIIGAKQEILEKAVYKLKKIFKGINILGYRNGYIVNHNEKKNIMNDILDKKPDVIFVATGSPKQEFFMDEFHELHEAFYMGLGGSIDAYVGKTKLAPKWWYEKNLEWLYRLIQQPTRLKRQINLIKFLYLLFFNKL